ncbi:Mor transcription activator family protein [Paenibacillus chibensis]|uniref:Mor transcription activator family protein n=1 Tax=Paenibacillus chibensis TaxID=59846 RepID=UPI0027D90812|nr:Mor transcription activator family protein [Paenibacillus chibensis]
MIERRNEEIYSLHCSGHTVEHLTKTYHLSVDSIRKVIFKKRAEHEAKLLGQKVSVQR